MAVVAAALVAIGLSGCGTGASAVLVAINGSGPYTSATFDPTGPWTVSYRWDCSGVAARGQPVAQELSWDVYNGDDQTYAADHPHVQVKGKKGSGTVRYPMSGAYYLDVSSGCDYVIQVIPQ